MKKPVLLFALAFLVSLTIKAQMPATTPLQDGDVEKFIKTYKPLTADLEALGEDFEEVNDYNMMQALAANQKVKNVFEKHGWDDQWMGKWITISVAYGLVKMEEELAKMSAEQRTQYEQYMAASSTQLKDMVTEGDIKRVKDRVKDLDQILEN